MKVVIRVFWLFSMLFSLSIMADENGQAAHFAVKDVEFEADFFPGKLDDTYGVIVLTGSSGGKLNELAATLNEWGHPVLSLAYFDKKGDGGIPKSLELIPLEYINKAKDWLMARDDTKNDGVVLVGLSKGAELALLLAAHSSEYKGVVAVAPSSVVWSGIPEAPKPITAAASSWSNNGKSLDFVPYVDRAEFRQDGRNDMLVWHEASLDRVNNLSRTLIPVEDIKSPLLLLSGGRDTVWPSNAMAASICARMKVSSINPLCTHINYETAGHMAGLDVDGSAAYEEMSVFLGGLKAGYITADDKYEIAVYGRNITDEDQLVGAIDFNNLEGIVNDPATWGVEFTARF